MTSLIVYDSVFGNTATVAKAIAAAREAKGPVRLLAVGEAGDLALGDADLLIVGSPTRGFNPTPAIAEFLSGLSGITAPIAAAAFDTRLAPEDIHPAPLRWVVEAGGYAAQRILSTLRQKGFAADASAGFLVSGQEGPLKSGELERAAAWAASL